MAGLTRLELATNRLKACDSTTELQPQGIVYDALCGARDRT